MLYLFYGCAIVGGTIFVLQSAMTLLGFGLEEFDVADAAPDNFDVLNSPGEVIDHGSTLLFGVISFRTIVAALTFFGVAGAGATKAGQSQFVASVIGVLAGLGAMYSVHFLMRFLYSLRHDGTQRIQSSIGKRATVYIPIPSENSGTGKIRLKMQERLVEYPAVTAASKRLATGEIVEVVGIVNAMTLEVKSVTETADV